MPSFQSSTSSCISMEGQLKELLQFLHDKNPQVRHIALENLLGHTPKRSAHRQIFFEGIGGGGLNKKTENDCIRDLKLLCRDQLAQAHDAFRALVNLSDNILLNAALSETSFLTFLVSYIVHPPSILADLAAMLLSNITAQTSTCATLLSLRIPVISSDPGFYPPQSRSGTSPPPYPYPSGEKREVQALPLLVQAFVQGAKIPAASEERTRKGELHFLASVFANLSTASAGRLFFLTPRPVDPLICTPDEGLEYPLSQLVVFTEHADTIRRGGVASTIKHCAFYVPAHKALLSADTELVSVPPSDVTAPGVNVLPYILLPLAGPEEFDLEDQEKLHPSLQLLSDTKRREPDEVLRLIHVETLILLCATRAGRDICRSNGVYEIIRTMHLSEPSDQVAEHVEKLVNLLKRDEAPISELKNDGWNHSALDGKADESDGPDMPSETPDALASQALDGDKAAGTKAPAITSGDDDDDMIVEV